MKKEDLKVGNVVYLRDGSIFTLKEHCKVGMSLYKFDTNTHDFSYDRCCDCFDDNIKHYNDIRYDVIKIYKDMSIYFDDSIKYIWIRDDLEGVKKGDLVWVSDDECEDRKWMLKLFQCVDNTSNFKYVTMPVTNDEDRCTLSYKYCKPAYPEDFQWFTEK